MIWSDRFKVYASTGCNDGSAVAGGGKKCSAISGGGAC